MVLFSQAKSDVVQTIDGLQFYIHKVEKKQSLYSISKIYGVTVDDILLHNPDSKTGIKAGGELKIPFPKPVVSATTSTLNPELLDTLRYKVYTVAKGETLYGISRRYNITEAELKLYNPVLISQPVKEGQQIIVGEKRKASTVKNQTKIQPAKFDSSNLIQIHKPRKTSYNISLLLPFKFDQSLNTDVNLLAKNNTNFPVVPALATDFYLGFKKAVDSLSSSDFEINLELYDINDKDSIRLRQITTDPKFSQTDMIFGPLYANSFKSIALDARRMGIPIVSMMTQTNKMLFDNIYASKTRPSLFTLLESLADYCIDSLVVNNANIILTAPVGNDAKEISYVKAFKKYYNEKQRLLGKTPKDTITVARGLAGVKNAYVAGVKNIIVTLSTNQVFIADFTTQLAIFADKKDITLCGWQNISVMDNIDQQYLNQLQFTFPYEYNLVNTKAYDPIVESYFSQQNTTPGENYFIGFDIAMYYLKNLKGIGPDCIFKLDELSAETNYMRFKYTRPDNITGFDNRGVFIFRYNNYQLQKSGWK
jgi:LysM repeat protein